MDVIVFPTAETVKRVRHALETWTLSMYRIGTDGRYTCTELGLRALSHKSDAHREQAHLLHCAGTAVGTAEAGQPDALCKCPFLRNSCDPSVECSMHASPWEMYLENPEGADVGSLLQVNPQWQSGQVVSDFGIFGRKAAEEFVAGEYCACLADVQVHLTAGATH